MSDNISRGLQAAAVNSLPFDNRDVEVSHPLPNKRANTDFHKNLSIAPPQKTKVKLEASESMVMKHPLFRVSLLHKLKRHLLHY